MRSHRVWGLSLFEREALTRILNSAEVGGNVAKRASAVLLAGEGRDLGEIAERVGLAQATVSRWIGRYQAEGTDGLADRPRRRKKIAREIASVDRELLASWQESAQLSDDVRRRARAMVLLADGVALKDICREIGVSGPILWKWRSRYRQKGVDGLRTRGKTATALAVSEVDRAVLRSWLRESGKSGKSGKSDDAGAVPARIVLLAAEHMPTSEIAEAVGRSPTAVRKWIKKFRAEGIDGVRPRPGARHRPPLSVPADDSAELSSLLDRPGVSEDVARRARAVLLVAEGRPIKDVALRLGVQPGSAGDWLRRYRDHGVPGLTTRQGGRAPKHAALALRPRDREILEVWANSRSLKPYAIRRARAVLLTADGESPADAAAWSRMSASSVLKWVDRYLAGGPTALLGPEPGDNAGVDEAKLVLATLESPWERFGTRYWNPQLLTEVVGQVSAATVAKVWSRWGLRPGRIAPWRFATVPKIAVDGHDVVGLYLNPPDRVLVLGSPASAGEGILDLCAELEAASPSASTDDRWHERHLRFLEHLSRSRSGDLSLVCDPGSSHEHPKIVEWLARHPRLSAHLPPATVSWPVFAKVWFGLVARRWSDADEALALAARMAAGVGRLAGKDRPASEFTWSQGASSRELPPRGPARKRF